MVIQGTVRVNGLGLGSTQMLYLRPGRSVITITAESNAKLLLIGGEPFDEELVMWWNFIGRTHEEVAQAGADWAAGNGRFGTVSGHEGQVIPAPEMPRVRLTPRRRRAMGGPA